MKDIVKTCGDDSVKLRYDVHGQFYRMQVTCRGISYPASPIDLSTANLTISALQEYIASQPGMQKLPSKKLLMDIDLGDLGERGVDVEYSAHGDEIEITDVRCEGVDIGKLVPDELEAKIIADIENEELEEVRRLGL